MNKQITINA